MSLQSSPPVCNDLCCDTGLAREYAIDISGLFYIANDEAKIVSLNSEDKEDRQVPCPKGALSISIKSVSEEVPDFHIDSDPEWTIRKLKEHLQNVYPGQPQVKQQRLIYNGRLLRNKDTLVSALWSPHGLRLRRKYLHLLIISPSAHQSCASNIESMQSNNHHNAYDYNALLLAPYEDYIDLEAHVSEYFSFQTIDGRNPLYDGDLDVRTLIVRQTLLTFWMEMSFIQFSRFYDQFIDNHPIDIEEERRRRNHLIDLYNEQVTIMGILQHQYLERRRHAQEENVIPQRNRFRPEFFSYLLQFSLFSFSIIFYIVYWIILIFALIFIGWIYIFVNEEPGPNVLPHPEDIMRQHLLNRIESFRNEYNISLDFNERNDAVQNDIQMRGAHINRTFNTRGGLVRNENENEQLLHNETNENNNIANNQNEN